MCHLIVYQWVKWVKPCLWSDTRKMFHGIVLHILEDSAHVTLTFSQALCHQQLQKSSQLYFEKLK